MKSHHIGALVSHSTTSLIFATQPIPEFAVLQTEVAAWEEQRNQQQTWINWRFTTTDARVKLRRLYPLIKD